MTHPIPRQPIQQPWGHLPPEVFEKTFPFLDGQSLARVSCVDRLCHRLVHSYKERVITNLLKILYQQGDEAAARVDVDRTFYQIDIARAFAPLNPERSLQFLLPIQHSQDFKEVSESAKALCHTTKHLESRDRAKGILEGVVDTVIQNDLRMSEFGKGILLKQLTSIFLQEFPDLAHKAACAVSHRITRAQIFLKIAQNVEPEKRAPYLEEAIKAARAVIHGVPKFKLLIEAAQLLPTERRNQLLQEVADSGDIRRRVAALALINVEKALRVARSSKWIDKAFCLLEIVKVVYISDPLLARELLNEADAVKDTVADFQICLALSKIDFKEALDKICALQGKADIKGAFFALILTHHSDQVEEIVRKKLELGIKPRYRNLAKVDLPLALSEAQNENWYIDKADALFSIASEIIQRDPHLAVKLACQAVATLEGSCSRTIDSICNFAESAFKNLKL